MSDIAVPIIPTPKENKGDTLQDAALFLRLYDRVYFRTDRYEFTFNFADIKGSVSIGSAQDRFVPVVINYLPDNTSWVYIEDLESLPD